MHELETFREWYSYHSNKFYITLKLYLLLSK